MSQRQRQRRCRQNVKKTNSHCETSHNKTISRQNFDAKQQNRNSFNEILSLNSFSNKNRKVVWFALGRKRGFAFWEVIAVARPLINGISIFTVIFSLVFLLDLTVRPNSNQRKQTKGKIRIDNDDDRDDDDKEIGIIEIALSFRFHLNHLSQHPSWPTNRS